MFQHSLFRFKQEINIVGVNSATFQYVKGVATHKLTESEQRWFKRALHIKDTSVNTEK